MPPNELAVSFHPTTLQRRVPSEKVALQFKKALSDFRKSLRTDDVALFYFSGHGLTFDGVLFFVPNETPDIEEENDIPLYCMSLHDIFEELTKGVGGGFKLLICDACRTRQCEKITTKSCVKASSAAKSTDYANLRKLPQSANSLVVYATAESTEAYAGEEGKDLSKFTHEFVSLVPRRGVEIRQLLMIARIRLKNSGAIPHEDSGMLGHFYFHPEAPNREDFYFTFVGNPGVGKSTILNGLAGAILFKSGVNPGGGMTRTRQVEHIQGFGNLIDTPGVADVHLRDQAALEIGSALMRIGQHRLFFILELTAGRVRPMDKTTMKLVLDACQGIPDFCYSIILNKLPKKTLQKLRDNVKSDGEEMGFQDTVLTSIMSGLPLYTHSVHFVPKIPDLEDEDDQQIPISHETRSFIEGAPAVEINGDKQLAIKAGEFQKLESQYQEQLQTLGEDAEQKSKQFLEMKAQQAEQVCKMKEIQDELAEAQRLLEALSSGPSGHIAGSASKVVIQKHEIDTPRGGCSSQADG